MYLITVGITWNGYTNNVFKLAHSVTEYERGEILLDALMGYTHDDEFFYSHDLKLSLGFSLYGKDGLGWIERIREITQEEWDTIQKLQINS